MNREMQLCWFLPLWLKPSSTIPRLTGWVSCPASLLSPQAALSSDDRSEVLPVDPLPYLLPQKR